MASKPIVAGQNHANGLRGGYDLRRPSQLEERIHVAQLTVAVTMSQSLKLAFRANLNFSLNRIRTTSAVNKMNMQLVTTTHGPWLSRESC
jgi:hypothetical protein